MKHLLLFTLLSTVLYAQEVPDKWKPYITAQNNDGNLSLIEKGKKAGVYDISQDWFLSPMQKQDILFLNESNVIVRSNKEKWSIMNSSDDSTTTVFYHTRKNEVQDVFSLKFPRVGLLTYQNWVYHDLGWSNLSTGDFSPDGEKDLNSKEVFFEREITIQEVNENQLIINHYLLPYVDLNEFDQVVVHDTGFAASGLYDLELNEWLIPQKYQQLFLLGDHILAFRRENIKVDEYDYSFLMNGEVYFDLYEPSGESWLLKEKDILDAEQLDLKSLFDFNEMNQVDYSYYTFEKNEKKGLLHFYLSYDPFSGRAKVEYNEIISCAFDAIFFNPDLLSAITYQSNSKYPFKYYELDQEENSWKVDSAQVKIGKDWNSSMYFFQVDDSTYMEEPFDEMPEVRKAFKIEQLNDSLLKIIDYYYSDMSYALIDPITGEFIVDEYGNILYERNSAITRSGIYNAKSQSWVVSPEYLNVWLGNKAFVVANLKEDNENGSYDIWYQLVDNNQTQLAEFEKIAYAFDDPSIVLKIFRDYEVDSLFSGPSGLNNIHQGESSYYFRSGKDMGLVYPWSDDPSELLSSTSTEAFLYENYELDMSFKCDRTNLMLAFRDTVFKTPMNNGKIEIKEVSDGFESTQYVIYTISANDTLTFHIPEDQQHDPYIENYHAYMQFENNLLIMNESAQVREELIDIYGEIYTDRYFDLANSAFWKYENDAFEKASPYYGTIEPTPFGYIVQTVGFSGEPVMVDGVFQWADNGYTVQFENQVPSRFLLLDDQLKAISFLDYYDFESITDLGYGLKLQTEKGYMFVSYEGKAITTDEWDTFDLEDGKLKAIQLRELYDEYGEPLFDENGNIIDDPIKTVEYFDLKK